ncbi:MAG: xanthine dehydrogenase family protein subunit M [Deltaproteobacteria bacterium]|nr:xanthine dehydrogenase family protein subunit M [Deltaproteobacteria bacterium]
MKAFDHVCPTSVAEAVSILSMHRGEAKVLAGGTDLLNLMRDGEISPKLIVSLKNIGEFRDITKHDGGVSIGAFCTLEDCARSERIRGEYPILYDAFQQMGSLQVRSRGTIGGNICNASPAADTAAPLMVLGAETIIQGAGGERKKPIVDFFTGPGETILEPDEILTTITLPKIKGKGAGLYVKLGRRNAMEIAIIGVAVYVILEPSSKNISDIRIAISSAAPKPLRVDEAESILKGRSPEKQLIEETASIVSRASDPISDVRASKEYRKEMLRVLTIRAITDIVSGL